MRFEPANRLKAELQTMTALEGVHSFRFCGFASLRLCVKSFNRLFHDDANKITILRILLIPFFVVELIYYLETGNEVHRLLALLTFAVAAILDGVDGYIARVTTKKASWVQSSIRWRTSCAPVGHRHAELQPRAVYRANSALAYRYHHRTRFAGAHRHCRRSVHRRQSDRASALHG